MGFIRSAGSCMDSGSDVYRTSDKTLFITFAIKLWVAGPLERLPKGKKLGNRVRFGRKMP